MKVSFTIPGTPIAKGRPKFASRGKYVQAYTPEKTLNYENLVKVSYPGGKLSGAIEATIYLFFPIPKSTSKKKAEDMRNLRTLHTKKPDADNCIKAILDALNNIAYDDDSQIAMVRAYKFYSDEPKADVVLAEIDEKRR